MRKYVTVEEKNKKRIRADRGYQKLLDGIQMARQGYEEMSGCTNIMYHNEVAMLLMEDMKDKDYKFHDLAAFLTRLSAYKCLFGANQFQVKFKF